MSKATLHFQGLPGWAKGVMASAPFRWVMVCDPGDNVFPGQRAIGRVVLPEAEERRYQMGGAGGAEQWYGRVRYQMLRAPWVYVWQTLNEPDVSTGTARRSLFSFTGRASTLMRADGLRVGVGAFARGTPQLRVADPGALDLADLAGVFEAGDYLLLHEYGLAPMQRDAEWHCLRHRLLVRELRDRGIRVPPILITEAGIDAPGGWREQGLNEEQYWEQLRWYDAEVEADPEVLAYALFTAGPDARWRSFEVTESMARKVAWWVAAHPPVQDPPATGGGMIQEPPIVVDGQCYQADDFERMVEGLDMGPVRTLYIHHTASPPSQWRGLESLRSLARWYETRQWTDAQGRMHSGWTAGPHLFVAESGIWTFTRLTQDGVGVAGHNAQSRHIEIVGNYHSTLPARATLDNAVRAAAAILKRAGLGIEAMRMHRQDQATECPGDELAANWAWFQGLVAQAMAAMARREGLPSDETTTDAPTLADKCRWWMEEAVRAQQAGRQARAWAILEDLVRTDGLLYRLERTLKG